MKNKVIFWILLIYLLFQWAIPFAQKVQKRRYQAPAEYNQRMTQETYDDMSKRLQDLEGGQ